MTKLKLPDVGDHLLLKIKDVPLPPTEILLTSIGDEEYCAINLKTSEGITCEDELICCESIPELLGEIQKHCDVYFMEDC